MKRIGAASISRIRDRRTTKENERKSEGQWMHKQAPWPYFEVFPDRIGREEKTSLRQLPCYSLGGRRNNLLAQEKYAMGKTCSPLPD